MDGSAGIAGNKASQEECDSNVVIIPTKTVSVRTPLIRNINEMDVESQSGRFGWPEATTDIYYGIPYILRNSTRYFEFKMLLTNETLRTHLLTLHSNVYNYHYQVMVQATECEIRLLNEINKKHCDNRFGPKDFFDTKSFLIRESDAYELYEFLDTCHRKLTGCTKIISNKIGFIQFDFSSIFIPYVMRNNELYMPMYCFSNVNHMPLEFLSGWDSAYLRFCCLYQGVCKGPPTVIPVVSLTSLRDNLPIGTQYVT